MTTASHALYSPYRSTTPAVKRGPARPVAQAAQLQYPWMTDAIRRNMGARALRLMRGGD